MKYKQKQEKARLLYLNSDLNQKQIAENIGVTENTISKWIEKFGWKKLKVAMSITKDKIIATTYLQIAEIQQKAIDEDRTLSPSESDQILKLSKVVKDLSGSLGVVTVIGVLMNYGNYIQKRMSGDRSYMSFDDFKKMVSYHDDFVSFMMNQTNE